MNYVGLCIGLVHFFQREGFVISSRYVQAHFCDGCGFEDLNFLSVVTFVWTEKPKV